MRVFSVCRPGPEDVGDLALVDEGSHLRLAHRELAAVLNLHVLHGIAVGEDAVIRLVPLNDVDELLGYKLLESHVRLPSSGKQLYHAVCLGIREKAANLQYPAVTYNFLQYL